MSVSKAVIRGRVARVLNSRELVLNIGRLGGVATGMVFSVLDPKGEDIEDPETGEVLGSLKREKVRVTVTEVQDRLSVAKTFRKKKIRSSEGGIGLAGLYGFNELSSLLQSTLPAYRVETLRADEYDTEELDESESYVKGGDPVVQVLKDVQEEDAK